MKAQALAAAGASKSQETGGTRACRLQRGSLQTGVAFGWMFRLRRRYEYLEILDCFADSGDRQPRGVGAETARAPEPGDLRAAGTIGFPISCCGGAFGFRSRGRTAALVFLRGGAANLHDRRREGSEMRDGAVGHRDDLVASDLDAADAGGNEAAGRPRIDKAMAMSARDPTRARIHRGDQRLLHMPPDTAAAGAGGAIVSRPGRDRASEWSRTRRRCASSATSIPTTSKTQMFYAFAVLAVGYATPNDTTLIEADSRRRECWKSLEPRTRSIPASRIT